MSRTFDYCRVSTIDHTVANQITAFINAGYDINDNRIVSETISGKTPALQRTEFKVLIDNKLEAGDTLIVLKLDRLGRDSIDVQTTVNHILAQGIKLIVLDLPAPDLSSPNGKMMVGLFSVFAQFERDRIAERTREGLARVKALGKKLGRPVATNTTAKVQEMKATNKSQSKVALALGISLPTVKRHWNKAV